MDVRVGLQRKLSAELMLLNSSCLQSFPASGSLQMSKVELRLEKTLENPLDSKEIQPVHLKGDQAWVFIGRTDAKAETPILWPPDVKN